MKRKLYEKKKTMQRNYSKLVKILFGLIFCLFSKMFRNYSKFQQKINILGKISLYMETLTTCKIL